MPDIIQVAEDLKNAPDQWLAQQMQNPSGSAPPWLVASEVARRERLRSGATKAQAPQSSVSEDLIRSLYARIPPTAGLMPQAGPSTPPGMPPVNLTPGSNSGTLGAAPGGTPPGNFKMPARMASGGQFDEDDDEEGDRYSLLNLPMSRDLRTAQKEQFLRQIKDAAMGAGQQVNNAVLGAGQTERNAISGIIPRQVNDVTQGMGQTERNIAGGIAGDYGTAAGQVNNAMRGVGQTERNVAGGISSDYLNAGRAMLNGISNTAGQVNNAVTGTGQVIRDAMGNVINRIGRGPQGAGPAPQQAAAAAPNAPPNEPPRDLAWGTHAPPDAPPDAPPNAPMSPPDPLTRLVEETAQRYELPPELLKALIGRESSWNPQAIGPVTTSGEHALGLMQVLPSTAAGEFGVTDPRKLLDPATNMDVGARYLKKLLVMYNGDTNKALMAYNMGPGALARNGGRPYQSTDAYVKNINDDINAQRKQENKPLFDYSQTPNARSRLLDQTNRQAEDVSNMPAPAVPAAPPGAPMVAPVAPGAPATKATTPRQEPLHQTWTPSAISPEAAIIQKQIEEKQQGHVPVEQRLKDLLGQENLDLLNNAGRTIFGPPPDYSKYSNAISQVMAMAQRQMNPSISQGLIDWGLAMMSNPSHNFGVAMGQAGTYAMQKYQTTRQEGMKDFLAATKAGMELQDKENQYNEKIGQYKMQRLGARESGITGDERAFQNDINALFRQKNTAQINYEKTLTTPDAVNNMAMAILNRERITYNPQGGDPIDQLVATGNKAWVDEAYLSARAGAGTRGTGSVERTQDMRATSLLAMMKHTWNPEENPDDAQFPNATKKLEKMYPELLSLATTAAGANLPEQMRESEGIADAIMAGNQDPNMTGMYGKQTLVKFILESKYKFDLVKATQEFNSVRDFLRTAQSGPRVKFMTDLNFVSNQIPLVMNGYNAWKQYMALEHPAFLSRYPVVNRAALEASIALGGKASEIATPLLNHVNELVSTLPGVYSGGFAPHNDDAMRAGTMLHAWSDEGTFKAAMKVITDTTLARKNAMNMVMPFGVPSDSKYIKNLPGAHPAAETREYNGHTYEKQGNQWVLVR